MVPKCQFPCREILFSHDSNALGIEVGDKIQVYEKRNTGQWYGKNLNTGKEGLFPFTHVRAVNDEREEHHV